MAGFWSAIGAALDAEVGRRMRRASRVAEYAEPAPPIFEEEPAPDSDEAVEEAVDEGEVEISNVPRGTKV
jgi:hypothetical protein